MTTEEGNGLIRVFDNPLMEIKDGWVCAKEDGYKFYPVDSLKYHLSWDWLMPVVEKCYKLSSIGIRITYDIDEQWKIVISFIKARNQQNKS